MTYFNKKRTKLRTDSPVLTRLQVSPFTPVPLSSVSSGDTGPRNLRLAVVLDSGASYLLVRTLTVSLDRGGGPLWELLVELFLTNSSLCYAFERTESGPRPFHVPS